MYDDVVVPNLKVERIEANQVDFIPFRKGASWPDLSFIQILEAFMPRTGVLIV